MLRALNSVLRKFADLPPHTKLGMPSLSPTMTTGTIVKWLKKEGERVKAGESMFEVETDKATVAFEVQDDVFLAKILADAGSSPLPLGAPVAILVDKADRMSAFSNYKEADQSSSPSPQPPSPESAKPAIKSKMSPAAHTMIDSKHLDPNKIQATGPKGLILKEDVLNYLQKKETPAEAKTETVGVKREEKKIEVAIRDENRAPRFSVTCWVGLDQSLGLFPESVNAFLVKAATATCQAVPEANSKFFKDFTRFYSYVDTQVYVYSQKNKVQKYFLQDCEKKRVADIQKGLNQENVGKANFEISFGTEANEVATPVTSTLLSLGPVQDTVVSTNQGLKTQKAIKATLNCDHRAVDGAVGAKWLQSFKHFVEHPTTLI